MPSSLYDVLFLVELAPAETVARHFRSLSLLCNLDKGNEKHASRCSWRQKNRLGDKIESKLLNKRGLDAAKNFASSQMDL